MLWLETAILIYFLIDLFSLIFGSGEPKHPIEATVAVDQNCSRLRLLEWEQL